MEVAVTATTDRIHARAAELGGDGPRRRPDRPGAGGAARGRGRRRRRARLQRRHGADRRRARRRAALATSTAAWEVELARTLSTAFLTARAFAPGMVARGHGRIVIVSSITGPRTAIPGAGPYGAAKGGMEGLMRGLALELAPHGVTVNAVAPGWIATASSPRRSWPRARARRPAARDARRGRRRRRVPRDPAAAYVTGHSLVVDGGNTLQELR